MRAGVVQWVEEGLRAKQQRAPRDLLHVGRLLH